MKSHRGAARSVYADSQASVDIANCLVVLTPPRFTEPQIPKSSDPLAGVAGVNVRDAFAASKSFTIMAADYSQIEVCPLLTNTGIEPLPQEDDRIMVDHYLGCAKTGTAFFLG